MPEVAFHGPASALRRVRAFAARLRDDERGIQFIEFAVTLPFMFAAFGFAIEDCNIAIVNLKVSQYALNLADNASRVGLEANGGVTQLREADINDVFQGMRLEGTGIKLTTYGRVTLSSLENVKQSYDTDYVQRIHWQRCIGQKSGAGYDSSYGTTSTSAGTTSSQSNAGTAAPTGMGDTGAKVNAPKENGVMFVEVNYDYQPIFGSLFVPSTRKIHYVASFLVRDNRDYTKLYGTDSRATCNLYPT